MKYKWPRIIALISILLLTLCLSACQKSDEAKYKDAQSLLGKGQFAEAAAAFDELGSYEDSSKLSMYCKAAAAGENGDYVTAFSTFRLLGDYKESQFMITYYQARQYESAVVSGTWIQWGNLITAAEQYDSLTVFRDSKERAEACRKKAYDYAVELAGNGQFSNAIHVLNALGNYSDSVFLSKYYTAASLEQTGSYREASDAFAEIGDFKDAKSRVDDALQKGYDAAVALEQAGDTTGAYAGFIELGDYKDALERACKPYYDKAETLLAEGDYVEAARLFSKAYCYKDGLKRAWSIRYQYLKYNQFVIDSGVFAITADGTVAAAFDTDVGSKTSKSLSRRISEYKNRASIYHNLVAIDYHCGLCNDGTVIFEDKELLSYQTRKFTDIVQISGYYNAYYGLKADGTVVTTSQSDSLNETLSGWNGIVEIARGGSGGSYVYGLRYDGTVLCARGSKTEIICRNAVDIKWADELGSGGIIVCLLENGTIYSPGDIPREFGDDFPSWNNVKDIFTGEKNVFAVSEDGALLADGSSYQGKKKITYSGSIGYVESEYSYTIGITTDGVLFYAGDTDPIDFASLPGTVGSALTLK